MTSERIGFDFVTHVYKSGEEVTIREAVETLCDADHDEAPMNDKELNFINDIQKYPDHFTLSVKQADWLDKIYKKRYIEKDASDGRR